MQILITANISFFFFSDSFSWPRIFNPSGADVVNVARKWEFLSSSLKEHGHRSYSPPGSLARFTLEGENLSNGLV